LSGGGGTLKINSFFRVIDFIDDLIGKVTSFFMVVIIGYMVASAIVRYFFHSSINYLSVVPNIFFVYVCLGAAYAYNQRAFVVVDILYRRFPLRVRAALDITTSFLFFTFMWTLLQVSGSFAGPELDKFKFTPAILIAPDKWPITIIFPIGPILMIIAGSVRLLRNIIILVTGQEPPEDVKEDLSGADMTGEEQKE
jgi:TRAP-type mannitol/chloroaromatic compound transport system permease small subunit